MARLGNAQLSDSKNLNDSYGVEEQENEGDSGSNHYRGDDDLAQSDEYSNNMWLIFDLWY